MPTLLSIKGMTVANIQDKMLNRKCDGSTASKIKYAAIKESSAPLECTGRIDGVDIKTTQYVTRMPLKQGAKSVEYRHHDMVSISPMKTREVSLVVESDYSVVAGKKVDELPGQVLTYRVGRWVVVHNDADSDGVYDSGEDVKSNSSMVSGAKALSVLSSMHSKMRCAGLHWQEQLPNVNQPPCGYNAAADKANPHDKNN